MRLQFPRRISLSRTFLFAVFLFCVQQLQHTGRAFSLLCCAFLMLSAIAFNLAQGFGTVIGSYVFWFSLLTVDIGIVWKAILREPADSNLAAPLLCISAYTVSMALLIGVVLVNRRFDLRSLSIAARIGTRNMDFEVASAGCLIAGVGIPLLGNFLTGGNGSLLSILIQINVFPPVAILLGTIAAIRSSGGRRSVNLVSGLGMLFVFVFGALNYSKQGMLTPFVCWIVPCFYMRYRINIFHGLVIAAVAVFAFTIVPVWSNGRLDLPVEGAGFQQQVQLALFEARHYDELKERVAEVTSPEYGVHDYYDTPQGLFDRLTILPADDPLFAYSETHAYFGYAPIRADVYNWIPHVILPNKPAVIGGNAYAHEIGGLAPDDFTTGISFSPRRRGLPHRRLARHPRPASTGLDPALPDHRPRRRRSPLLPLGALPHRLLRPRRRRKPPRRTHLLHLQRQSRHGHRHLLLHEDRPRPRLAASLPHHDTRANSDHEPLITRCRYTQS